MEARQQRVQGISWKMIKGNVSFYVSTYCSDILREIQTKCMKMYAWPPLKKKGKEEMAICGKLGFFWNSLIN